MTKARVEWLLTFRLLHSVNPSSSTALLRVDLARYLWMCRTWASWERYVFL
jgi:hypothetical protein